MKAYRTEIVIAILCLVAIVGIVIFYLLRMDSDARVDRVDVYDLILPDAQAVLSINRPKEFIAMLKEQPQLNAYFREVLPDESFRLLYDLRYAPVLLVYYSQHVALYYPFHDMPGEKNACFPERYSVSVKKEGVSFEFYPQQSTKYWGCYLYKGVYVASYSRKLLEAIAEVHRHGTGKCPLPIKRIKDRFDKNALFNASFHTAADKEWLPMDVFIHEKQVCSLLNYPVSFDSDSLITEALDSFSRQMEQLIPGLTIQSDYSKGDSVVYYTFCTSLEAGKTIK